MRQTLLSLFVLLTLGIPTLASSATVTHSLNFEFSGGTDPAGSSPWVNITFDDFFGGPNTVRLTIANTNLVANEFNSAVYLNFDPALDPIALSFNPVDYSASTPRISTGVDGFKADGDGFFDILFDFPPPPGQPAAKFTGGEAALRLSIFRALRVVGTVRTRRQPISRASPVDCRVGSVSPSRAWVCSSCSVPGCSPAAETGSPSPKPRFASMRARRDTREAARRGGLAAGPR